MCPHSLSLCGSLRLSLSLCVYVFLSVYLFLCLHLYLSHFVFFFPQSFAGRGGWVGGRWISLSLLSPFIQGMEVCLSLLQPSPPAQTRSRPTLSSLLYPASPSALSLRTDLRLAFPSPASTVPCPHLCSLFSAFPAPPPACLSLQVSASLSWSAAHTALKSPRGSPSRVKGAPGGGPSDAPGRGLQAVMQAPTWVPVSLGNP